MKVEKEKKKVRKISPFDNDKMNWEFNSN